MEWHIGCSGFHYKHWKNDFYPEGLAQRKWFDYYSQQFNTLELNVTFYRFPRLPFLQNWYQTSPAGFRFAVKAPRAITHFKQFHNSVDMLTSFYATINEGLKEKLGPVLFQFPSRFTYTEEKLDRVIKNLDPSFQNVLEFRHPDWWRDDIYQTLAAHNVSFCSMSHPELPQQLVVNTPLVYYRFHGVPALYYTLYDTQTLAAMATEIAAQPSIKEAWLYFNNDIGAHAPQNAAEMIALTTQAKYVG
jgi:uncharacterized protein YecE (DUF72 family)